MLFVLCPLLLTYREVEEKPPLCKGRWLAKQDGGIVKAKPYSKTIPQSLRDSSLYTREPFYVHL